jgi:2'-5' RNA ligase
MTGRNGGANPGRGKLRLFVALDLPESVRDEVEAWRREVLTDPALRHNAGLRMVLLFLGHRPARDVPYYLETIRGLCAAAPAPLIQLGDAVPKGPQGGRPRLFTLPAKSPEAEVLHTGLRSYFAKRGLVFHEPERRAFWPHVTVARVRTEKDESRRPELIQNMPDPRLPASLRESFEGQSVGLYRSEMRGTGARYELLGKADLPGATFATLNSGRR